MRTPDRSLAGYLAWLQKQKEDPMAEAESEGSYRVRSRGEAAWHIPNDLGLPRCGARLRDPERVFLPAALAPADIVCPECLKLYRSKPRSS